MNVFDVLLERCFFEALGPGGYMEHIHALGILKDPWRKEGDPPRIEDPPDVLLAKLRRTGYDLRPWSWAPPPDAEGARIDPVTGRTVVLHLVRVLPLGGAKAEVETVYYRHWMAAGGSIRRYFIGPKGWTLDAREGLAWEA